MAILFAAVVALIHVYIFYLQSIAWGRAGTNRIFRVTEQDAASLKVMAFNQGFYNLFLAVAILVGFALTLSRRDIEGHVLMDYAAVSVLMAGLVLFFSHPRARNAALIQALPAIGYLGFHLLSY